MEKKKKNLNLIIDLILFNSSPTLTRNVLFAEFSGTLHKGINRSIGEADNIELLRVFFLNTQQRT